MIPKTIHYCWFGRGEKPELTQKCIESWKKFCPDYEIIEWNEDNFDINSNLYVKQAYEARKFAFVTDYVRLWAMYHHGGIYMDTDVEVRKSLDEYLHEEAFSGFESKERIPTGIMASEKDFPLFGDLLAYYKDRPFVKEDGSLDLTTNVITITNMLTPLGFAPNGEKQTVAGFTLYPQNVFCPLHKKVDDAVYMKDTATIHWFAGSWKSEASKKREKALWWKIAVVPAMAVSKAMRKLFGDKWENAKNKVRDKILSEK
ncbi:MAG: glycosyl transferase [Oscillospiraceae bacterium]|nr:glycosyl transferase [Oscillospiraceae bacterium]